MSDVPRWRMYPLPSSRSHARSRHRQGGWAPVPLFSIGVTGGETLALEAAALNGACGASPRARQLARRLHEPLSTENPMIPFVIVKTKAGFAYLQPEHIVALSATDPAECLVLMTDGVTIAALEPA
jgi:hypothetical protein